VIASLSIQVWDNAALESNGYLDEMEERFVVSGSSPELTLNHPLSSVERQLYSSSDTGTFGTEQRSPTVGTVRACGVRAYTATPLHYAGVYNVTDASGSIRDRRYVGEGTFYAVIVNLTDTGYGNGQKETWLVPRSVFFETYLSTRLNKASKMTGTWLSDSANGVQFTQNASDGPGTSALAVTLTAHLDYAEYTTMRDWLMTNVSGNVTHTYLRVDWEPSVGDYFFLLGLPDAIVQLASYQTLANTPSTTYVFDYRPVWQRIWDGTISAALAWIASGFVAAVNFMVNLPEMLAQLGAWLWSAIVGAGQAVASAVQAAAEAFVQMLDALADAILAVIHAALDPLINLVVAAYTAWANEVAQLILSIQTMSLSDYVRGLIQLTFFSTFALAIFAVIVAFSVAEKITNAMTLGLANLAGIVIGAVAGLIIGMLVVAAINEWIGSNVIEDLLPSGFDEVTGVTFTVAQFLFAYELAQRPLKPIRGIESGLHDAIVGLMLLGVGTAILLMAGGSLFGLIAIVIVDAFALFKELSGLGDVITISGTGANFVRMWYPFLYPVTVAMNAIGIATAATDLAGDVGKLVNRLGEG
jgi:hypothetical protein